MKFRYHKGSLLDSLDTTFEVESLEELYNVLLKSLLGFGFSFSRKDMSIKYYGYDSRINAHNYLICINKFGVIGFIYDTEQTVRGNDER